MRRVLCTIVLFFFVIMLPLPGLVQAAGDEFAVQFIVPSDKDDVWKFVEMISDLGYPAYMFTQDMGSGVVNYYAQMGTYANYAVAKDAAEKLRKKVRVDYEIVHANTNKAVSEKELAMMEQEGATTAGGPEAPPADTPDRPAEVMDQAPAPAPAPAPQKKEAAPSPAPAPQPAPQPDDVASFDAPTATEMAPAKPAPKPAAKPAPKPEPEQPTAEAAPSASAESAAPQVPEVQAAAPAPTAPEAPAAPATSILPPNTTPQGQSMYLAQMHSFSIKDNALKAAREYSARGYDPVIILLYDSNHTPWYVLSMGYWGDMRSAREASQRLRIREGRAATINQVDASFLKTRVVPF